MITDLEVRANLESLDQQFQASTSNTESLFCAKMAVIELCGWIEEAMDDIVMQCSARSLQKTKNHDYCLKTIVGRNSGFGYKEHFRRMLMQVIGLIGVEKVESATDAAKFSALRSELGNLKVIRNQVAHTYTKISVQVTLTAPSSLIPRLTTVYNGLKEFDREISNRQW